VSPPVFTREQLEEAIRLIDHPYNIRIVSDGLWVMFVRWLNGDDVAGLDDYTPEIFLTFLKTGVKT
jgi:hypothetical protein